MVLIIHILVIIIAFSYRFAADWFINEKQRLSINEWQARTELDMLKSQINPHFLFNALNNLFSMSLKTGDEKTAEGISKLSEMMRYVFDKSKKERVSLEEEVQYIEDYIYLQKLRFEDSVEVKSQFSNECLGKRIAPMLLIPFVENAFKYGVNSTDKHEIDLSLRCDDQRITFRISNEIVDNIESISSSGVGIVNVQKRLELLYPDAHSLTINDDKKNFSIILNIDL